MILGIDPGLANTGWSVVEGEKLVDYGCIETSDKLNKIERLGMISDSLEKIIEDYKIKTMALENLFFAKNVYL